MDIGTNIREAVIKYSDTLYKVCIVILCNEHDVQDAIQDTFCRYLEEKPSEHSSYTCTIDAVDGSLLHTCE